MTARRGRRGGIQRERGRRRRGKRHEEDEGHGEEEDKGGHNDYEERHDDDNQRNDKKEGRWGRHMRKYEASLLINYVFHVLDTYTRRASLSLIIIHVFIIIFDPLGKIKSLYLR
jgi:hypothetical protein